MKMVVEYWLLHTFNECEQLQHDCYLQPGLLKIMIGYFLVRLNFILICLWVIYLKFGVNPMEEGEAQPYQLGLILG